MKKTFILLAIVGFLAAACDTGKTVSEVHKFKNGVWERFDYLNFQLPVEDSKAAFDLSVELSFTSAFPAESLYVNVVMTTPSGEERIKDYNFTVKDANGNFLGTKTEGVYRLSVRIRKGIQFNEAGICKFEIENLMPKYVTPGIIDFGINLQKKEK